MTQPVPPPVEEQLPPPEPSSEDGGLSAFEVAFAAIVLAALTRWLSRTRQAVLGDTDRYGAAPDPDEIMFTASDWISEVDKLLIPELRKVAEKGWRATRGSVPIRDNDEFINDALATARNLLVRIPDEVYAKVNAELLISVQLGENVYEQARRVDRVLTATGSENWAFRSRLISITEVNRAYNAGSLAAGFQAQQIEGQTLYKRWNAVQDARTRVEHRVADGQTQPLSTPFQVGSDRLMYPGDPSGSPHSVIGCRCSLDIVDQEEL